MSVAKTHVNFEIQASLLLRPDLTFVWSLFTLEGENSYVIRAYKCPQIIVSKQILETFSMFFSKYCRNCCYFSEINHNNAVNLALETIFKYRINALHSPVFRVLGGEIKYTYALY